MNTARLEAFSDGVFAIAATLLVIDIKVPTSDEIGSHGLWFALANHWPSYVAFALSFIVIGIMWANHHNICRYLDRTNQVFIMLNLMLLMCTVFLPFPTAVLATYLPTRHAHAAAVLYGATLAVTAVFYNFLWRYAATNRRLLKPNVDQQLIRAISREYLLGPVFYATATLVALFSVSVSLAIHALLAIVYVIPNKTRM